jgi:hypothetical protein
VHDAVLVGRDAGDDRDATGLDQVEHRLGAHLRDLADQAEIDLLAVDDRVGTTRREQAGVLTRQSDRQRPVLVDQSDQLALDLADQHHPDDVHRRWSRHPEPTAELRLDAEPVEHGRDLRTTPVHDDRPEPGEPQERHVLGERPLQGLVGHRVAAVLHDHDLAVVALQPRQSARERGGLGGVGNGRRHGWALLRRFAERHELYAEFSWT